MAASNFHFYARLFTELNMALTTYINDTATNIIGAITPVATTLLTIYVCLWGWSMMRGVISEPVMDGVSRIVRLALITAVALQIGNYNGFLSDFLWSSPDALASYINGNSVTSNVMFLDSLMSQMHDFGDAYYQKAYSNSSPIGIPDLGMLFTAYALWVAGLLATGYGAFLLALAKMGLAVALGVGPIFVLLIMFEPTKRFFNAWLGQALNFVFMVMLSAATLKLIMSVLQHYLTEASTATLANPALDQALPAIVFSIIGVLVLMQMPAMASALGGGVAIGTLGAVGWAYGKAKGGASAMRPTNLKRSANKVRSDIRIAANTSKAIVGAPMAVYRKITGGPKNRIEKA